MEQKEIKEVKERLVVMVNSVRKEILVYVYNNIPSCLVYLLGQDLPLIQVVHEPPFHPIKMIKAYLINGMCVSPTFAPGFPRKPRSPGGPY